MRNRVLPILLLVIVVWGGLATTTLAATSGNLGGYIGYRKLDSDWGPIDEHPQVGLLFDIRVSEACPVHFAADLIYSWESYDGDDNFLGYEGLGVDLDAEVLELNLGGRYYFTENSTRLIPYLGGGFARIPVTLEGDVGGQRQADDDTSPGVWLNAGCYIRIVPSFSIGLDARWSWAEIKMYGEEFNGGGWQLGSAFTYHW